MKANPARTGISRALGWRCRSLGTTWEVAYESGDETMRIVLGFDHDILFDPATLGALTTLIGNDRKDEQH